MSNPTPFQSKLRQTYSEQPTENATLNTPSAEPSSNQAESPFNNNSPQSQPLEPINNYTKQTYPIAQSEATEQNSVKNENIFLWTAERIQFTVTNCSFTAFLSCLAAAIMLYNAPFAKGNEAIGVFTGQAIGGILIGIATSLVLWPKLKSGESMTAPLGLSNLFTTLTNIPIGIMIAASLLVIFTSEIINMKIFLEAPFIVFGMFYWVPIALLPVAIACWGAQSFLVNRYFANFLPNLVMSPTNPNISPTKFSVKRLNTAARCDICHREDMFDSKIGFCRRCQRYTI